MKPDARNSTRALQFGGAAITFATNTEEALEALSASAASVPFDLIISDIKGDNDATAGITMIDTLRKIRAPQLLFNVGTASQPPPAGRIFGCKPLSKGGQLGSLPCDHFDLLRSVMRPHSRAVALGSRVATVSHLALIGLRLPDASGAKQPYAIAMKDGRSYRTKYC